MEPLKSTPTAAGFLGRVTYTHDAMIDCIIAMPEISGAQLAAHFGYTEAWISRCTCSDAFQARLAERRTEICNPALIATFEERLKGLAMQSLEAVCEKLNQRDADTGLVDPAYALKALELSTKSLGYGARQTNVAIQNNMSVKLMTDEQLMQIAGS